MASETVDRVQCEPETEYQAAPTLESTKIRYSVGVMAYNEEANIRRTLQAIMQQQSEKNLLSEIIVVASGCTDQTVPLVQELMQSEPCLKLIMQERREGKASAINLFLQQAVSPVLVMVGADIIPEKDALEKLCLHMSCVLLT